MYREENNQVVLTMSREDWGMLLIILGYAAGCAAAEGHSDGFLDMVGVTNRLNEGNPNYRPYQVAEKK
jgi:hypothetical protein